MRTQRLSSNTLSSFLLMSSPNDSGGVTNPLALSSGVALSSIDNDSSVFNSPIPVATGGQEHTVPRSLAESEQCDKDLPC